MKPRVALNYAGNVLYYALLGAKRTKCVHVYSLYRAMLARTVLSQVVRPSVRVSHAGIVLKRLNMSSNFLHRRVATFFEPNLMAIFRRGLTNGGVECRRTVGYEKIAIFDQYLALSRK